MQETNLYLALLSELSSSELVEVIGREMRRRGQIGFVMLSEGAGAHTHAAGVYPPDWEGFSRSLSEQMRLLAAYVSTGEEVERRLAGLDDDATGVKC